MIGRVWGFSVGEAAWGIGVTRAKYRQLETGARVPDFATYDRIRQLFGWPQRFVDSGVGRGAWLRRPRAGDASPTAWPAPVEVSYATAA